MDVFLRLVVLRSAETLLAAGRSVALLAAILILDRAVCM